MKCLVTGAAGFVGSCLVRQALRDTSWDLKAFARRTNDQRLQQRVFHHPHVVNALESGRLEIIYGDLCGDISGLCEGVDLVYHAGAKTFVDHSIRDPGPFFESNTIGTYRLIEEARRHNVKKYLQVSTDEVYGPILKGEYAENSPIRPTNPYSASKAAADAIVQSYAHAFKMNTVITRTENNYGPYQHPQKAIPVFVKKAMKGEPIPIYGDGMHKRQWLWVEDHVEALIMLLSVETTPGDIYHVAASQEITNLELAFRVLEIVHEGRSLGEGELMHHIQFVDDGKIRPGHDRRYALDSSKLRALGWRPRMNFIDGLQMAVKWHMNNPGWNG
jgi:dTDP-glucose 4,6-dehydratase